MDVYESFLLNWKKNLCNTWKTQLESNISFLQKNSCFETLFETALVDVSFNNKKRKFFPIILFYCWDIYLMIENNWKWTLNQLKLFQCIEIHTTKHIPSQWAYILSKFSWIPFHRTHYNFISMISFTITRILEIFGKTKNVWKVSLSSRFLIFRKLYTS